MNDRLPRLYRSLEKRTVQTELDSVLMAAVASYTAMLRPGETHARNLARLIVPAWPMISGKTQAEIAGHLALSPELTPDLVATLATAPITIIRPEDLAAYPATASGPTGPSGPSARRPPRAEPVGAVDAAREALRWLARPAPVPTPTPAREAWMPDRPPVDVPKSLAQLFAALREAPPREGFSILARFARLDTAFADEMASEASGFLLASVLKAIGARFEDSVKIGLVLVPSLALNAAAFAAFKSHYRNLDRQRCRTRLGLLEIVPAVHTPPRHARQEDVSPNPGEHGHPRPAFGRRGVGSGARNLAGS